MTTNRLLMGLDAASLERMAPLLERVPLRPRLVLVEPHVPVRDVFFIESGTASVVSRLKPDRGLEVSMIGCMGVAGLPAVLGTVTSPFRCLVQIPGTALRMSARDLRRSMDELPAVRQRLMNYVQARMIQQAQITVCNATHLVSQRVARWLLMGLDRLEGDTLPVTHGLLGRMLGVRRAGVSMALQELERDGTIERGRGCIRIVDRAQLESAACGCYKFIGREFDRLICRPGQSNGHSNGRLGGEAAPHMRLVSSSL